VELDEVIDEMIAERVIHRHRRKWIVFFVLLVVGILVVWLLNGWDEPKRTVIKTVDAPYTFEGGRFEYQISDAALHRTPKGKYTDASAELIVSMGIKNIDEETKESTSVQGDLLYLLPRNGKPVASNGATCNGDLNYKLVYGLPTQECTVRFEVPPTYTDTDVRMAIFTEEFRSDADIIGASENPYWHEGDIELIVKMSAKESAK
jgi:hypothetical protein